MNSRQIEYVKKQLRYSADYVLAGYHNMIMDGRIAPTELPDFSELIDEMTAEIYDGMWTEEGDEIYYDLIVPDWVNHVRLEDISTLMVTIFWNEYVDGEGKIIFPS